MRRLRNAPVLTCTLSAAVALWGCVAYSGLACAPSFIFRPPPSPSSPEDVPATDPCPDRASSTPQHVDSASSSSSTPTPPSPTDHNPLRTLVVFHSGEVWGDAAAAALVPPTLSVDGVAHALEVHTSYDAATVAAFGGDAVLLLNANLVLLGDGPAMARGSPADRAASTLAGMLRALQRGAAVAGCSVLGPGAVVESGFELLPARPSSGSGGGEGEKARQGEGRQQKQRQQRQEWVVGSRLSGEDRGSRPVVDKQHASPVALAGGDCLGIWTVRPETSAHPVVRRLAAEAAAAASAARAEEDASGGLDDDDIDGFGTATGSLRFPFAPERPPLPPTESSSSGRAGGGGSGGGGGLLATLVEAERAAPEVSVLSAGVPRRLGRALEGLRRRRAAVLGRKVRLEKRRRDAPPLSAADEAEAAGVEGALRRLDGHFRRAVALLKQEEPETWLWRRAVPDESSGDGIGGDAAAPPPSEQETDALLASLTTGRVKDWVSIGCAVSAAALRRAAGDGLRTSPVVVQGGAVVEYAGDGSEVALNVRQRTVDGAVAQDAAALGAARGALRARSWYLKKVVVVWLLPCCNCCGFVHEAVAIIKGLLELNVDVRLSVDPDCLCDQISASDTRLLRTRVTSGQEVDALAADPKRRVFLILHGVPFSFHSLVSGAGITALDRVVVITRVMYEFTVLPADFVGTVQQISDEVWVPSHFVQDVCVENGVTKPIVVVHESVETDAFHSTERPTGSFPPAGIRKEDRLCFGHRNWEGEHFKFLSMFKWEARKGWEVLVEAYLRSFTASDRVGLYISSIPHSGPLAAREEIQRALDALVLAVVAEGAVPSTLPYLCVLHTKLPAREVSSLFAAADAFVLPTRGEGWGLPILQAMATGLPTIATAWSGQMDFMSANNSYLLKAGLEEIPTDSYYGYAVGKRWAQPNGTHLVELMKQVVHGHEEAKERGRVAEEEVCRVWGVGGCGGGGVAVIFCLFF